jgi:hypothetical protein
MKHAIHADQIRLGRYIVRSEELDLTKRVADGKVVASW